MLLTVAHVLDELRISYSDLTEVLRYFDAVQQDMVEHVDDFRKQDESMNVSGMTIITHQTFHNYQVNVLVTNNKEPGTRNRARLSSAKTIRLTAIWWDGWNIFHSLQRW